VAPATNIFMTILRCFTASNCGTKLDLSRIMDRMISTLMQPYDIAAD
jgi:hypothetical protein